MNKREKVKIQKQAYHIFAFFVVLLSLSVGYAAVSYDLEVDGTLSLQAQREVVITNVEEYGKYSEQVSTEIVRYEENILQTSIQLDSNIESYVTFAVTIENVSNKYYLYKGLNYDTTIPEFYSNPSIIPTVLGITENYKMAPHESKTIYLKYYYASSDTSNTELDSIVSFKFNDLSNLSAENLSFNNTRSGVNCSDTQCMIEYLKHLA